MKQPWFYPDKISATPGERVSIAISAPDSPCTLRVTRVGAESREVLCLDGIAVPDIEMPENADSKGCDWPESTSFVIGDHWTTGYYDLALSTASCDTAHHFVCVKKAAERKKAKAVIVLTTNTYAAYNYWGGANSYAHVLKLQNGELKPAEAQAAAIGTLSWRRPLAQSMFAPPAGAPRLVIDEPRGLNARPLPQGVDWIQKHRPSSYDGSAGFLGKWEHRFAAWAEEQGYDFDFVTDFDFETDDSVLSGYSAAILVGHSEYWSANGRRQMDQFVDEGGNLAVFSGNTSYWKVRWDDDQSTMVAHKWRGEANDPLWANPKTRDQATHLWSHPEFNYPEASTFGLSFLYGGYHRLAMCAARGAGGYTVYNDTHWALEETDLFYGDVIGSALPLLGYENDGCPIQFDDAGLPAPNGGVGVPSNLSIIAMAPATLAESPRSPFDPVIPPERPDVLAQFAYGDPSPESIARLMRGHVVMASFTRGEGEVFNAGTTEWAHGLAGSDPFVERITKNVLQRFGAI